MTTGTRAEIRPEIEERAAAPAGSRRYFNVSDYERLGETGILAPDERTELINGEIWRMTPQGSRHVWIIGILNRFLSRNLPESMGLLIQSDIRVGADSQPQPDITVLRNWPGKSSAPHAGADNIALIIEVAVTSLAFDRTTKLRLYAEAGIPEYWIVDAEANRVEVYRRPEAGEYQERVAFGAQDSMTPDVTPGVTLRLAELFA